jgi:hypothetical protein
MAEIIVYKRALRGMRTGDEDVVDGEMAIHWIVPAFTMGRSKGR